MIFVFSVAKVHYLLEKVPCLMTLPWGLTYKTFGLETEESGEGFEVVMVGQIGRYGSNSTERPLLEGVLCLLGRNLPRGRKCASQGYSCAPIKGVFITYVR